MWKVIAAVLGIVSSVLAIVASLNELGVISAFPRLVMSTPPPTAAPPSETAEITLSQDRAPRGATLTVNGSGFQSAELVEIRIHVTTVGTARADSSGRFRQTVTVPSSAPPPGFPTSVWATGHSSGRTGTAPFSTSG